MFFEGDNPTIYFSTLAVNIILGLLVVSRRRDKMSLFFGAFVLSMSLWILTLFLFYAVPDYIWVNVLGRLNLALTSLFFYFLFRFVNEFPDGKRVENAYLKYWGWATGLIVFLSLATRLIDREEIVRGAERITDYGPLAFLFPLHIVALLVASAFVLWKKYQIYDQKQRSQIVVLVTAIIGASLAGIITNIILPFYGNYSWQPVGPAATLIFSALITYSILKQGMLNLKVLGAEFMVALLIVLNVFSTASAESLYEGLLYSLALLFVVLVGFALIRSVKLEVQRREQIEKLSGQLQVTNVKLKEANKRLRELDKTKTTFLSMASHQLRTPLAVAKGYLTTLERGMLGKLAPKQQKAVHILAKSNNELVALVNELLDLSRIESGRLVTEVADVDLLPIIDEVVEYFSPKAIENKLKFIWQRPRGKLMVKADPKRVKEVVKNFIDNGLKYTEKGTVTVSAGQEKGQAFFRVADTGYGMTQEDIQHLFEKFASGSASKKVKITSGFGLFVVKNIVEAMGGSVSGASAGLGKGSVFEARFKLAK